MSNLKSNLLAESTNPLRRTCINTLLYSDWWCKPFWSA